MIVNMMDVKWAMVKEFYEDAYSIQFKQRLTDLKIQELYSNMKKVTGSVGEFYDKNPDLERRYLRRKATLSGLVDSSS